MENKTYYYKKIIDMLEMSNEPNKMNTYTDKQFEKDLEKWFSKTKAIQYNESLKREKM